MPNVLWRDDGEYVEIHGIESVELVSVGIDIGTTTSHLLFSEMLARRKGGGYSSKFEIVERETVYKSPVALTPFVDETEIDTEGIEKLIDEWYADAGLTPGDVNTGGVIVTGEASRKENAEAISNLFSQRAGDFVCATAGANLEALMAAHGSGAIDYSVEVDQRVLHIDIGGGTTKVCYISDGVVESTQAVNVGARLVEVNDENEVVRFEPAARRVAESLGIELTVGMDASEIRERLPPRFAEILFEFVDGNPSDVALDLLVTDDYDERPFDIVTFSGGAAEYVYDREKTSYGDLGPEVGAAFRDEVTRRGLDVHELPAGIRATVLGTTEHSVQVSGNTITVTDTEALPFRNVRMVPFEVSPADIRQGITDDVVRQLEKYDVHKFDEPFAFGFHLSGQPTAEYLSGIVEAVIEGWERVDGIEPIIVAFDSDVALNAGKLLEDETEADVIAVDNIELDRFGYIDIGEFLQATNAVPITIKSLIFEG